MTSNDALLIAGDSHILSFGIPLKAPSGDHYLFRLETTQTDVFGLVGTWPRQFDNYWAAARAHSANKTVAVFWGGNMHLARFLLAPAPLFDVVASDRPDLPFRDDLEIMPEAAIRAVFRPWLKEIRSEVEALRSTANLVLIGGTPPPKEDDAFIRRQFSKEQHFVRMAQRMGMQVLEAPLSPPILRLKLWIILQGLLRDLAEETGARFIPVPAETQTPDGFLIREYYAEDVTHANEQYGTVMLSHLIAALS